jgi:hypothetical protein
MPRKRRDGQIETSADAFVNILKDVVIWKREVVESGLSPRSWKATLI